MLMHGGKMSFKNLDKTTLKLIASAGGKAAQANGTAHVFTSAEARSAGSKGGTALMKNRGADYMAMIGRRGGQKGKRSTK
jgi:general stress protein YciG